MSLFKFYVNTQNVVRWNSNDSIPFDDMLDKLIDEGFITGNQYENSRLTREKEQDELLARYIEESKNRVYTRRVL